MSRFKHSSKSKIPKEYIDWIFRAWPFLTIMAIIGIHFLLLKIFYLPAQITLVNKIVSATMQISGGLLVLYTVNKNLEIFQKKQLIQAINDWLEKFPLLTKDEEAKSIEMNSTLEGSGDCRPALGRTSHNIERRIGLLERGIEYFREEVQKDFGNLKKNIESVRSEQSLAISTISSSVNMLTSKVEQANNGFKEQTFGSYFPSMALLSAFLLRLNLVW
jgi:hypothetical protein